MSTPVSRRNLLVTATALVAGCATTRDGAAPEQLPAGAPKAPANGVKVPPVSASDVAAAEKLVDVHYTQAEREQIAATFEDMLSIVRARRQATFENHELPATRFDPRIFGSSAPSAERFVPSAPPSGPVPTNEEDLAFAPVTALSHWLRERKITSEQLTRLALKRLETHGPKLECVARLTPELALAQARQADRELAAGRWRGPLHGIPYGAKDLYDTAGIPTTWGAEPWMGRVPTRDAAVVSRLRDAGAVLVAKLTLGALAYGDIWDAGRTRNPWFPEEGSSGSSAGSAAAVAAGLVPFALGSETLGSIVSPSMRCGTTGLRPTFGRVPRTGAMTLSWTMDKVGPIARTVEDTLWVLKAIHGADPGDPSSVTVPLAFDANAPLGGYTVGYDPEWFGKGANDVDRAALEALRQTGVRLREMKLPELPIDGMLPILFAECAAAFEGLTLKDLDDQLDWQDPEAWPNTFRQARFLSAVDLVQADRLRRRVMVAYAKLFGEVNALFGPSFAGNLLTATNYTGHPSLTLRAGFIEVTRPRALTATEEKRLAALPEGPPRKVPHGVTLWGRLDDEGTLARIGLALEQRLGVWAERPR